MKHWLSALLTVVAVSPPKAAAVSGVQWLGDRLGLTRPVEELTGAAERRRTTDARAEAEAAEARKKKAEAELLKSDEEYHRLQTELLTATDQFTKSRSDFYEATEPVRARLFLISEFYLALNGNEQDLASTFAWLSDESKRLNTDLRQMNDTQTNSNIPTDQDLQVLINALQKAIPANKKIDLLGAFSQISKLQTQALTLTSSLQKDSATMSETLTLIANKIQKQNKGVAKLLEFTNATTNEERK